jgi:hypothetical protein
VALLNIVRVILVYFSLRPLDTNPSGYSTRWKLISGGSPLLFRFSFSRSRFFYSLGLFVFGFFCF